MNTKEKLNLIYKTAETAEIAYKDSKRCREDINTLTVEFSKLKEQIETNNKIHIVTDEPSKIPEIHRQLQVLATMYGITELRWKR